MCEEHNLGYEVEQGNTGSSFTRAGKPIIKLNDSRGRAELPQSAELHCQMCEPSLGDI